jgi:hypothetical protein
MTSVAILGCGPTGLVAAHAAEQMGADVTVYSKPRKSFMFGAQYLHVPIPGTDPGRPQAISYQLKGTPDEYRAKVYGADWSGTVSPEDYEGDHLAYDIRATYDELWEDWKHSINEADIKPSWIVGSMPKTFDYVLCTIPFNQLCAKGHTFAGQDVWAMGDAPERGQEVPFPIADGTVICNGEPEPSWYRASNIFGYKTVEWSDNGRRPPLDVARVTKPLLNNCNCWPQLTRIGRFGMWRKGILVHHAYQMTTDLLAGELMPEETRAHLTPCPMADPDMTAEMAFQLGCRCE